MQPFFVEAFLIEVTAEGGKMTAVRPPLLKKVVCACPWNGEVAWKKW